HPAKRIFQALRIAVNDELAAFNDALHQAANVVGINGRIAVITFHSLEDRLCKHAFKKWSTAKETPRNLPIIPEEHEAPFKLITNLKQNANHVQLNDALLKKYAHGINHLQMWKGGKNNERKSCQKLGTFLYKSSTS